MPLLPPWEDSPQQKSIQKVLDDAEARAKTVTADARRIAPKLDTYKAETLKKLIKEHERAKSSVLDKVNDTGSDAMKAYLAALKKERDALLKAQTQIFETATAEARKKLDDATKQIQGEFDQFERQCEAEARDAAMNPSKAAQSLYDEYEDLIGMLKAELKTAEKEKPPSDKRKV